MSKLLLHIGTGKTGSTTLQNALSKANEKNDLDGVVYPSLLGKKHHNELCTLVMPHERIRRDIRSTYPAENSDYFKLISRLEEQLRIAIYKNERVILSGEYFCGFNDAEVSGFFEIIKAMGFSEICVVVYFREPCSLYLSQVQQRIKASSRFKNPNSYIYNYTGIVERWGKFCDKIIVRDFDKDKLYRADVVEDFILILNEFFEANVDLSKEARFSSNESLSAASMALMQDYRAFFYKNKDNYFDRQTISLLSLISNIEDEVGCKERPSLKEHVKSIILSNHSSQMAELKEKYGIEWLSDSERLLTCPNKSEYDDVRSIISFSKEDEIIYNKISLFLVKKLLDKLT